MCIINPASILYKSTAGRYRPVSYPDGPITARYRFIKNAFWVDNTIRILFTDEIRTPKRTEHIFVIGAASDLRVGFRVSKTSLSTLQ